MWIKRRIKVFIARNYRKYLRCGLIYAYYFLRNSIDDKIWYWKSLRKAKKKYPKDTPMREMMIYNEINAMAMARQEEEIEKLWGNTSEPVDK